mmetsp:Transcript_19054/g.55417  ORF Transcript_19054/g.55417 Transcript_19054/m.55417 type:complete len:340 (-) Transcript_19054:222-1241(-)
MVRCLSQRLCHGEGALGKLFELEDAHGAVPDHGLAGFERRGEVCHGLRANVQAHPAVGDLIHADDLGISIGSELVGHDHVRGQVKLDPLGCGLLHEVLGERNQVLLHHGRSHGLAKSTVEGEDHAATDEDLVALVKEGLDHWHLGGHLGTTNHCGEGAAWRVDCSLEVLQLLFHEVPGCVQVHVCAHASSGRVGAVCGAKGIVHVESCRRGLGERLRKVGVVLRLPLVETHVLQEQGAARRKRARSALDLVSDAVVDVLDIRVDELREALLDHAGLHRIRKWFLLGAAKVGGDDSLGSLLLEKLEGRHDRGQSLLVGDGLAVLLGQGHVQVQADQDVLP